MGYYLRTFCRAEELPTLRHVFEWAAENGTALRLERGSGLDDLDWREAEIAYSRDRQPLLVDASRASRGDELLSAEIEEFVGLLEDVDDSPDKQRVLAQLGASRAVVGVQLLGDFDDEGRRAVDVLLRYFVEHCEGMIQSDGDGFWEGDRLLVELD